MKQNIPLTFYPDGWWLRYYGVWYQQERTADMFDLIAFTDGTQRIYMDLKDLSPVESFVLGWNVDPDPEEGLP